MSEEDGKELRADVGGKGEGGNVRLAGTSIAQDLVDLGQALELPGGRLFVALGSVWVHLWCEERGEGRRRTEGAITLVHSSFPALGDRATRCEVGCRFEYTGGDSAVWLGNRTP